MARSKSNEGSGSDKPKKTRGSSKSSKGSSSKSSKRGSKSSGMVKRIDRFGNVSGCSAKPENIGKPPCCHLQGDQYILPADSKPQDFLQTFPKEFFKKLDDENANENSKIKEDVPCEIVDACHDSDDNTQLVVAATGLGKSAIMHKLLFEKMYEGEEDGESIIVVPTNELADQFAKYGMNDINGYHVISYEKLLNWYKAKKKGKEYDLGFNPSECCCIGFDECHRSIAKQWKDACASIMEELPEDSKIYGFTATPERVDGDYVGTVFGDPVYSISAEEAIERNCYTNPPDYITSTKDYRALEELEKLKKDIDKSKDMPASMKEALKAEVDRLISEGPSIEDEQESLITANIDKIMTETPDEGCKIVVFCESTEDLIDQKARYSEFLTKKYGAENVESLEFIAQNKKMSDSEKDLWERFSNGEKAPEKGKIQIVYSIKKFDEGFHIDNLNIAIRSKPTNSTIVSKQEDGRMLGRRKRPGVILDFSGSIRKKISLDWHRIAEHVKGSDHYDHRDILQDNSQEFYSKVFALKKKYMPYSGKTYGVYKQEILSPGDIVERFGLDPDNSPTYHKKRIQYVKLCLNHGMTVEEIIDRKDEISRYYGGAIRGIDDQY